MVGPPGDFVRANLAKLGVKEFHVTKDLKEIPFHKSGNKILLTESNSFIKARGFIELRNGNEITRTFSPIDCTDIRNFEGDDNEDKAEGNEKESSPTRRQNYSFWFKADLEKLVTGKRRDTIDYACYIPNQDELLFYLEGRLAKLPTYLYLDIETHEKSDSMQCISIACDHDPVVTIPIYDHNGNLVIKHYNLGLLMQLVERCTVVGHNVSFDLGFLSHYHGFPLPREARDTMLVQHRIFPEAEKSMYHLITYWLNVPNHKGTVNFDCFNRQQYRELLEYNGQDVAVTRKLHQVQHFFLFANPQYIASAAQANAMIIPYLTATLTGFQINRGNQILQRAKLKKEIANAERYLNCLVGYPINSGSSKQVIEYLEKMQYPILSKTQTGATQVDAKTLYRYCIKFPENVALRVILILRDLDKTLSMLNFKSFYPLTQRDT
jgi:hypothetical protein